MYPSAARGAELKLREAMILRTAQDKHLLRAEEMACMAKARGNSFHDLSALSANDTPLRGPRNKDVKESLPLSNGTLVVIVPRRLYKLCPRIYRHTCIWNIHQKSHGWIGRVPYML